jgi:hypothetical protein
MNAEIPDDVNPNLAFFSKRCQGDDYLFDSGWLTFSGRMSAFCPHDPDSPDYRVSKYELPEELPEATRYWVEGFLTGNLPLPPDAAWDDEDNEQSALMRRWRMLASQFRRIGWWPNPEDEQAFYNGEVEMPEPPD